MFFVFVIPHENVVLHYKFSQPNLHHTRKIKLFIIVY